MSYQMLLFVLMIMMAFSCGSRKVDKQTKTESEVTKTSLSETKSVTEIEIERKKLYDLLFYTTFRADSIIEDSKGNKKYYNPQSTSEKKESKQEEEKVTEKAENTETDTSTDTQKEVIDKSKKVDKEQYNWWGIIIPVLIIAFIIYYFRKQLPIINRLLK